MLCPAYFSFKGKKCSVLHGLCYILSFGEKMYHQKYLGHYLLIMSTFSAVFVFMQDFRWRKGRESGIVLPSPPPPKKKNHKQKLVYLLWISSETFLYINTPALSAFISISSLNPPTSSLIENKPEGILECHFHQSD